ncbi:hypothetical protein EJ04DRAFT_570526 [Polyplosphaeria fusca]|uniref:Uncharacterized protein n=1 Tax=Polyplosphaeria fusca TaxID=682080 RepID=A0A9P4UVY8_9PLEO|nr:hypothetical protein EJ04DRAFT_570526 [Polyplosphaeria fusca]
MEKLKHAISHRHRKSVDAAQGEADASPADQGRGTTNTGTLSGEASHLADANRPLEQKDNSPSSDYVHPIYDEFTGQAQSSVQPTEAGSSANPSQASALRPDSARPQTSNIEGLSTASIKSGVLGFPQEDNNSHAALGQDPTGRGLDDSPSNLGQGTIAGTSIGLTDKERNDQDGAQSRTQPSEPTTAQPRTQTYALPAQAPVEERPHPSTQPPRTSSPEEAVVKTSTDRSFPLAGAMTSRKQEPPPSSFDALPSSHDAPAAAERAPGTEDKEVERVTDGREGLAGAAAAAAATASTASTGHRQRDPQDVQKERRGHGDALAAALAASSLPRSGEKKETEHEHGGLGHTYDGPRYANDHAPASTGPTFTSGPHVTDTANRTDPHLHIPGEFPDPTPIEEPPEPAYNQSPATTIEPANRQTERVSEERTEKPTSEHHYGRDAAVAGGLGAAGLTAYEAGKHHQREPADVEGGSMPVESSPYSAKKLDPRVSGGPVGFEEQRYDPGTGPAQNPVDLPKQHDARDPTIEPGTIGGASLVGSWAEQSHPKDQENTKPLIAKTENVHAASQEDPEQKEKHHGRDAALVGTGAATAGGVYYATRRSDEQDSGPASATMGPHKSNTANILDSRVQPDPALLKNRETGPTPEDPASRTVGPHKSNIANIADLRVQPEPAKQKQHTTIGPHESDTLNRLDPKVEAHGQPEQQHHYGRDAALVGATGAVTGATYEAAQKYDEHRSTQPAASMEEQRYDPNAPGAHDPNQPPQRQHHYGRDAAIAGGLGTAGTEAYMVSQRDEGYKQPTVRQHQPLAPPQPPMSQGAEQPTAIHQRYDSTQEPREQDHTKRNAAAAAGVTGVAGAGAYEYSKHDAEKVEKERLAQQKAHERELKEQDKAFKEQQKEHEKMQAKEQKEHSKFMAAEEKKHHKEVEKEQAKHQKDVEKEEARQQEELDKEDQGEKKKHHLFGFLHRDKKNKEKGEGSESGSPRHSKEYAVAGAGAGVGAEATRDSGSDGTPRSSFEHKGRNRLHKDPPKGHPAREAMEQAQEQQQQQQQQHMGIDGPIGRAGEISGDHQTRAGVYGAHTVDDQQHGVTEPHTGLPMNVEKYGDGHGGVDGSETVHGYHQAPGAEEQGGQQQRATDWEAIRKANTPY